MNADAPGKPARQPNLDLLIAGFLLCFTLVLGFAPAIRIRQEVPAFEFSYLIPFFAWLVPALMLRRAVRKHLPNRDTWIMPLVMGLTGWGIMMIWRLSPHLGLKQAIWFLVGTILFMIGLKTKGLIFALKRYKYVWLMIGLILIGLTFFVGVNPSGGGEKLWLNLLGVYVQPSEPLKLLMIVYLAAFFADQVRPNLSLLGSILPTILVTIITALLLISQRDLGTASLFVTLYVLMLTVTTNRRRFLWIFPLLVLLAAIAGYFSFDVVKTRLDIWLNPWLQASNAGYQIIQARIAIAVGGLTGTGPGLGSPQFVPVAVSDFIFSAIAEEMGLFGTSALMMFILLLTTRGIVIAQAAKTTFARYLAFGISAYFALQSFFIIGGNLGLVPLTGVTLPFLSYGGSSLVTNLIAVLLLLRISCEPSVSPLPEKTRKPYQWMAAGFLILFGLVLLKNSQLAFFSSADLASRPENPRWAVYDRFVPRGGIETQSGEKLLITTGETGSYSSEVTYPPLSNIIGYANGMYGQSGLQKSLYPYLRGYSGTNYETLFRSKLFYNQPPPGSDIKLNLNLSLQKQADSLLGEHRGAITLINSKSGEIYVLATSPTFDANDLADNWKTLMARQDAPLLSRSTQGSYPIGTLSNLIALSAFWSEPANQFDLPPESKKLDHECFKALSQNQTKLDTLKVGCAQTARLLLSSTKMDLLFRTAEAFKLYDAPDISLEVAQPYSINLAKALVPTRYLETMVSPLQMALAAATISNQGMMPSPKLVNSYLNEQQQWVPYNPTLESHQVIEPSVAHHIQMQLESQTTPIWYQIGHAESAELTPITWYVGGTTQAWKGSPFSIAIVLEESNPVLIQEIGLKLLTQSTGQ